MHERNPYHVVDFNALAEAYPSLKPHVFTNSKGLPSINFKDVISQRRLTKALLQRDFNLTMTLPADRLCPAVPNRLDYVLWIQDLVDETASAGSTSILGVDIGTGASAIYALLACRLRDNWRMVGTDIDDKSMQWAKENIVQNGLQTRIELYQSTPKGQILDALHKYPHEMFMFVMCNPPFYSSAEEIKQLADAKEFHPHAVCTGADVEMITDGGEAGFVTRMIHESKALENRCRWYTSLLGKLSSLILVVESLKDLNVDNYGIAEFVQSHTKRWAIVWSFGDDRLPDRLTRISRPQFGGYDPLPNEFSRQCVGVQLVSVKGVVVSVLRSLKTVQFEEASRETAKILVVTATGNCWSRSARRKKEPIALGVNEGPAILTCTITLRQQDENVEAQCRWIKGRDRSLFETFWSHLSRKLA